MARTELLVFFNHVDKSCAEQLSGWNAVYVALSTACICSVYCKQEINYC